MNISASGLSGAIFTLEDGNLRKRAAGIHRSAEMQSAFKSPVFVAPKVISIEEDCFTMQYLQGAYVLPATEFNWRYFLNDLIDFIKTNITGTHLVHKELLVAKASSIISKNRHLSEIGSTIIEKINTQEFYKAPSGNYHGDLTLCNILSHKNRLYLIDFLPGYINSPILDLVKIRQELGLTWSAELMMVSSSYYLCLQAMAAPIGALCSLYDTPVFEIINLFRILPYITDKPGLQDIVVKKINQLL